jgi:hypothetical protein
VTYLLALLLAQHEHDSDVGAPGPQ